MLRERGRTRVKTEDIRAQQQFPPTGWVGDRRSRIKAVGGQMGVQLWETEGDLR